jgi:tRNA A37 N6-isopentenylltransferase MiaA
VHTRRYAARQMRWFAGDPRVRWVRPDEAVAAVTIGDEP